MGPVAAHGLQHHRGSYQWLAAENAPRAPQFVGRALQGDWIPAGQRVRDLLQQRVGVGQKISISSRRSCASPSHRLSKSVLFSASLAVISRVFFGSEPCLGRRTTRFAASRASTAKFLTVDRLREVSIHSSRQAALAIPSHDRCGGAKPRPLFGGRGAQQVPRLRSG
jgi:hypothetical protein